MLLLSSHPNAWLIENEHHAGTAIDDQPGETPDDCNDRAIRAATLWYAQHATDAAGTSKPSVVLLTNDRDNQRKARTAGLRCLSVVDFVQLHAASHASTAAADDGGRHARRP